jgi:hypothetical protein
MKIKSTTSGIFCQEIDDGLRVVKKSTVKTVNDPIMKRYPYFAAYAIMYT